MEEYKLNINMNKRGLIWQHIGNEADEHAEGKDELYLHILCEIVLSWQRIEKCSKIDTTMVGNNSGQLYYKLTEFMETY
jgi:hypothetical protein